MSDITCKNDLYGHLDEELIHTDRGRSRGVLRRVRAAYDFCHFEVAGGDVVRRDVDEVINALEQGY